MFSLTPIVTAVIAFAVCSLMGYPFIPYLKKLKYVEKNSQKNLYKSKKVW